MIVSAMMEVTGMSLFSADSGSIEGSRSFISRCVASPFSLEVITDLGHHSMHIVDPPHERNGGSLVLSRHSGFATRRFQQLFIRVFTGCRLREMMSSVPE